MNISHSSLHKYKSEFEVPVKDRVLQSELLGTRCGQRDTRSLGTENEMSSIVQYQYTYCIQITDIGPSAVADKSLLLSKFKRSLLQDQLYMSFSYSRKFSTV